MNISVMRLVTMEHRRECQNPLHLRSVLAIRRTGTRNMLRHSHHRNDIQHTLFSTTYDFPRCDRSQHRPTGPHVEILSSQEFLIARSKEVFDNEFVALEPELQETARVILTSRVRIESSVAGHHIDVSIPVC